MKEFLPLASTDHGECWATAGRRGRGSSRPATSRRRKKKCGCERTWKHYAQQETRIRGRLDRIRARSIIINCAHLIRARAPFRRRLAAALAVYRTSVPKSTAAASARKGFVDWMCTARRTPAPLTWEAGRDAVTARGQPVLSRWTGLPHFDCRCPKPRLPPSPNTLAHPIFYSGGLGFLSRAIAFFLCATCAYTDGDRKTTRRRPRPGGDRTRRRAGRPWSLPSKQRKTNQSRPFCTPSDFLLSRRRAHGRRGFVVVGRLYGRGRAVISLFSRSLLCLFWFFS